MEMDDKEKEELNRREFFKCCAKAALPIIGGILLSKTEVIAQTVESVDCNHGCSYSCRASCRSSCMATCQGACMSSCSNSCAGTCKNECSKSCSTSCQNTSKAEPVKVDTVCQKKDTILINPSK